MSVHFDFNEPISNVDQPFEDFVKEAEQDIESSKQTSKPKIHVKHILFAILILNILGIGIFGFLLITKNTPNNNEQVAGVQTSVNPQVVTGNGFSIVSDTNVPKGYVISTEVSTMPVLEDKPGITSRYLIDDQINNQQIKSGFEIISSEYDNKLDINQFTEKVKTYLGEGYTLDPKTFTFPKDTPVKKLINNQGDPHIFYYTTVTSDNYYLIKVYNQTINFQSLLEYTNFINNLENTLYLN